MRTMYILLIFLNLNLLLSLDKNPTIFKNNFDSFFDYTCVHTQRSMELESINGVSYYVYLDTNNYKNQNIGFILEDLSSRFSLLEFRAFNGWELLRKDDYCYRSHFSFYLKMDDSTALVVRGCISQDRIFYEEDDAKAIQKMLEIDSYILNAYQINNKILYQNMIKYYDKETLTDSIRENIDKLLYNFPDADK